MISGRGIALSHGGRNVGRLSGRVDALAIREQWMFEMGLDAEEILEACDPETNAAEVDEEQADLDALRRIQRR